MQNDVSPLQTHFVPSETCSSLRQRSTAPQAFRAACQQMTSGSKRSPRDGNFCFSTPWCFEIQLESYFVTMVENVSPRLPYIPRTTEDSVGLPSLYTDVQHGFIRVVKIGVFGQDGLLMCKLNIQKLNHEPYTAISYTWNPETSVWYGNPVMQMKPIRLNGHVVLVRHKIADILCLMQYV